MVPPSATARHERSLYAKIINTIAAFFILFIAGILFPMISECLFDNDQLAKGDIVSFLKHGIEIKNKIVAEPDMVPDWAVFGTEGVIFGSIVPFIEFFRSLSTPAKNQVISLQKHPRIIYKMCQYSFGFNIWY